MKSMTSIYVRGCYPNTTVTLSSSSSSPSSPSFRRSGGQPPPSPSRSTTMRSKHPSTSLIVTHRPDRPALSPAAPLHVVRAHEVPVRSFATTTGSEQQQRRRSGAKPLNTIATATLNILRELSPDLMQYVVENPETSDNLVLRIPSATENHLFATKEEFLEVRCQFNETHGWHELVIRWPVVDHQKYVAEQDLNVERIQLLESDGPPNQGDLVESVKRALAVIDALLSEKTKVGRLVRMKPPYSFRVHDKAQHDSSPHQHHDVKRQDQEGAPIKVHGKSYYVTMDPHSIDSIVSSKIMDAKERCDAKTIPRKHTMLIQSWRGLRDEIAFPLSASEYEDEWGKNVSIE